MEKNQQNKYIVDPLTSSNALLFNFKGYLFEMLSEYLRKYSISTFEGDKEMRKYKFKYVFHKDSLNKITKTLYIAQKNKATFILLTKEDSKDVNKIISVLHTIRADVEIFLFPYSEPENEDEARKIIKNLFEDLFINKHHKIISNKVIQKNVDKPRKPKQNIRQSPPISKFTMITSLLLFSIFIYLFSITGSFYLALKKLDKIQSYILKGQIDLARKESEQALRLLVFGEKMYNFSYPAVAFIIPQDAKAVQNGFRLSELLAKTISQAAYTSQIAQTVGEAIMSSRTSLHESQLATLQSEVKTLDENVQKLIAEIKSVESSKSRLYSLLNINQRLKNNEVSLKNLSNILSLSSRMSQLLPEILGYDSPKTFLLLFQNNSELRPTGGFIGSFGWVTFSQGKLIEFKTEDVYTADGQLKGYVEPPDPIKKYLQQENWYLRDSNFDPDFSQSATQAEWFLKHELNLKFDGVFAFDLNAVSEIIRGLNGVYVPDYAEEVTADNLFLKTQTASEMGFFPGSTQKRDFIGSLTRALFIKLTSDHISWPPLINGIKKSLDEKNVLLYLHNENGQKLIEEAGWGGRIASVSCVNPNCIADYLMIVEANLGINKANFLITRDASLAINRDQNILRHELKVTYTNESHDYVYPGGTYFSYSRILIPKNASFNKVRVGSEEVKAEDITLEEYQDKLSVGFPMRISGNESKQIILSYDLPVSSDGSRVELLVQKQPGIKAFPLNITVNGEDKHIQQEISSDHLISLP